MVSPAGRDSASSIIRRFCASAIDQPAKSRSRGLALSKVIVSSSGAGPVGFTSAATIRTVRSGTAGSTATAWPVRSSVCQAWD
jgi:hypothetical protein